LTNLFYELRVESFILTVVFIELIISVHGEVNSGVFFPLKGNFLLKDLLKFLVLLIHAHAQLLFAVLFGEHSAEVVGLLDN
jgi:hypothetical protein